MICQSYTWVWLHHLLPVTQKGDLIDPPPPPPPLAMGVNLPINVYVQNQQVLFMTLKPFTKIFEPFYNSTFSLRARLS